MRGNKKWRRKLRRIKKLSEAKNFVKVCGEKAFIAYIMDWLDQNEKYDFYNLSRLKKNFNEPGFHRYADAIARES